MSVPQQPKKTISENTGRDSALVFRAKIFFVIVCISLLAVDGWQAWKARTERLNETETSIVNMARALAQHGDDTLKAADLILSGTVDMLESEGIGDALKPRMHKLLKKRVSELAQLAGLLILDAEGNAIGDSNDTPFSGNVSGRAYFRYHRDHPDRRPYVGPLIKNPAGAWRLTVSRRFDYPDGRFRGVVLAAIDIDYFRNFYNTFNIGKNGLIILGLNEGTMLVRRPFFDRYVGVDLNNVPIFRDYVAKNHDGTHTTPSTVDGKDRINAYRHFNQFPLFVAIALSKEEVLDGWAEDTLHHTAGILILILILALLGNWLLRQIKLRLETEAELMVARDNLDQLNKHLQNLALEDSLTGLANRRHFDIGLSEEFARALRNNDSLALIMLDVDWFKQYNDIYGHRAGDDCLRRIADLINKVPHRLGDMAARYGGEEMVVLLPQTTLESAAVIAERIRAGIVALDIRHAASPLTVVTVSAGVAAIRPKRQSDQPEQLVEQADRALYVAKAKGRNCVARHDDVAIDSAYP
ncbi:sensor domain-containing diguanylate cyclase [Herbaspirillum sp. RV1423]|uniref:sensor domain-containing diguanylate cyclase n=1 Tax=Herbaspirillum sp. RV1423 TaxID=1443993 RepID=UPI0004B20E4F|nr:sensor domain-containing diguanylate cyclase [Herbaspirillum sp. RV1423]